MKTLGLILLSLLACAPAAAQNPAAAAAPAPGAHGVSVVKATWRKQTFNPALLEDPLSASNNTAQLLQARKEITRENNERAKAGIRLRPMPTQAPGEPAVGPSELPPSDPRVSYLYEVKVVNTGTKKIRSLVWEYVVFDPATEREVGRHAFETKAGIGVGKGQTLSARSELPPASVVDVSKTDREARGQFAERVEIRRVVYEGGAVWEREPR
ncbi:MAG TPA: hypothetical protein VF659_17740 [Pyrinomonadaceae bacterium]|jgi:hypothetical protein